jgi:hypothetical protein
MMFRPSQPAYFDVEVISPFCQQALGERTMRTFGSTISAASGTWTANLAVFIPFGIVKPFLVREVWWANGSTAGNNIDVGIYSTTGTRLASLGSTAQGSASAINTSTTWTDYTLAPGDYYMAFACDGTTNDVSFWVPGNAASAAGLGIGQQASAMALPSSATIVPLTNLMVPYFGLNGNTVTV